MVEVKKYISNIEINIDMTTAELKKEIEKIKYLCEEETILINPILLNIDTYTDKHFENIMNEVISDKLIRIITNDKHQLFLTCIFFVVTFISEVKDDIFITTSEVRKKDIEHLRDLLQSEEMEYIIKGLESVELTESEELTNE